jgi:hypothetical protein
MNIGDVFTRQEISHLLGGSIQSYLPERDGRVVCGCFKPDDDMNPNAPEEVLFGTPDESPNINRAADLVFEQGRAGQAIPVFLKDAPNRWRYVGDYLCIGLTRDPRVLERKLAAYPRRRTFHGVLRFERVA